MAFVNFSNNNVDNLRHFYESDYSLSRNEGKGAEVDLVWYSVASFLNNTKFN